MHDVDFAYHRYLLLDSNWPLKKLFPKISTWPPLLFMAAPFYNPYSRIRPVSLLHLSHVQNAIQQVSMHVHVHFTASPHSNRMLSMFPHALFVPCLCSTPAHLCPCMQACPAARELHMPHVGLMLNA